jgi:hypothetical protein
MMVSHKSTVRRDGGALSSTNMPEDKPVTNAETQDASTTPTSSVEAKAETTAAQGEPMEIHAPDKPIHSKKEFMFHMFTVVLGILIALALDGIVQWAHHRALVREARENITVEIEKNKEQIDAAMPEFKQRTDALNHVIAAMQQLQKTHKVAKGTQMFYTMSNHDLYSTAWQTAATSGAVTYMSYDELRRYTDVYVTQQTYSKLQEQALDHTVDFGSLVEATMFGGQKNVSNDKIQAIVHEAYRQIILQRALEDVSTELSKAYDVLLKHP